MPMEALAKLGLGCLLLTGESTRISLISPVSQSIVNNMKANVTELPYDDHDRALKLLHALDCTVWGAKVEAIEESRLYETLTVDELFSKLKSSEVDRGLRDKGTRTRTRLILIVWLLFLVMVTQFGLTLLLDSLLCLCLCLYQMRSSM